MNWRAGIQKLSLWPPARHVYSFLVRLSIFRNILKKLSRTAVPEQTRIWVDIPAGLGKGLALHLDPRFEMNYASGQLYEMNLQRALSAYLQPGAVVYDVGAHIGVVSMFAAELVGTTGRVFAFEADPENVRRIEAHVQRNDLAQIQVLSCAAWSSSGNLSFERASAHSSRNQGSVAKVSGGAEEGTIVVESIRLDDFAQQHPPPTLLKIDVEGGEADVLLGCEQIFSRARPVLICEVHHREAEEDVCRWLSQRGYSLKWLGGTSEFPRHLLAMPISEPSAKLAGARGRVEKSPLDERELGRIPCSGNLLLSFPFVLGGQGAK